MKTTPARYRPRYGVSEQPVNDELVLLSPVDDAYIGLNAVGAKVWRHISEGATLNEVVDRLYGEFEVERSRLTADVTGLLSDLVDRGLVEKVGEP